MINYNLIDDVVFEGIDTSDYPDFCDAYIASATYDGREMSDSEIEELNSDSQYVYDKLMDVLY